MPDDCRALYLAPMVRPSPQRSRQLRHLLLCVGVAAVIAIAQLLALYKSNIQNVKLAGSSNREETYKTVTQFSLGPAETLTFLVPGFFGWHMNSEEGPYWGWIGEWPDWGKNRDRQIKLNQPIDPSGRNFRTMPSAPPGPIATVLASGSASASLLPVAGCSAPDRMTERQRFYGRVLLVLGPVTPRPRLGARHTPLYRPLCRLPLMDKWRDPLKWLEMTNFAMVTLCAFGMQHLLASLDAATGDDAANAAGRCDFAEYQVRQRLHVDAGPSGRRMFLRTRWWG